MNDLIRDLENIQMAFLELARQTSGQRSYTAFEVSNTCRKAAEKIRREIPMEKEIEGGGSTWWYVCPECHGAIDNRDHWCKHCGQAVKA